MPKLKPCTFYLPKTPENQVLHSFDDYTPEELKNLKKKQKKGFIQIIYPNLNQADKNKKIRERWINAISEDHFLKRNNPYIYYYKLSTQEHTYTGLICGINSKEFEKGLITQHEKTYPSRATLMASYLDVVQIQAEPVVVIAEADPLQSLVPLDIENRQTIVSFTFDQTQHQIWQLIDSEVQRLSKWSEQQPYFHLADGHHRVASLTTLSKLKNKDFLVSCFLVSQNSIFLHSFIWFFKKTLSTQSVDMLIEKIKAFNGVPTSLDAISKKKYDIIIKIKKYSFGISTVIGLTPEFIREQLLDTFPDILDELCYQPDVGPHLNPENMSQFDLVFYMKPCSKEMLFDYAKKGKILPAKSTYILPKLVTGLFISPL